MSNINYLIVAGGGSGSSGLSGGGGGGGVEGGGLSDTLSISTSQAITIGAGGVGTRTYQSAGTSGSNSSIGGLVTVTGGGYGGPANAGGSGGHFGGSGGGGGASTTGTEPGGAGIAGQGNNGGSNSGLASSPYPSGGGGGATVAGQNASSGSTSGNGGNGKGSNISNGFTGALTYYGGGGGGGVYTGGTAGNGGTGGGGAGGSGVGDGTNGGANTGGGGGGGGYNGATAKGGDGGSGIAILAYLTASFGADGTGGTITHANGYTIHTFTASGTFVPPTPLPPAPPAPSITPARQAFVMGQEITKYVMDWGELDEIKSVLLSQQQMFVGQIKLKLSNALNLFAPGNPGSMFYGQNVFNTGVQIYLLGVQVFSGYLKDVELDYDAYTADLVVENQFSKLASTVVVASMTGVNPAQAILTLLQTYGFSAFVNTGSFNAAAGPAQAAGAVISLGYTADNQVYLLDAINKIADLGSLTVYVQNNTIYCSVYQLYQGNLSNLRETISQAYVRSWGTRNTAYNNFYNQVIVPYGASAAVTLNNTVSQSQTGTLQIPSSYSFSTATGSTNEITVADLASATFFAGQWLQRASVIREQITVRVGIEFSDAVIGYRYPVSIPAWSYSQKAFEVIETRRTLVDNGVELTLASV